MYKESDLTQLQMINPTMLISETIKAAINSNKFFKKDPDLNRDMTATQDDKDKGLVYNSSASQNLRSLVSNLKSPQSSSQICKNL